MQQITDREYIGWTEDTISQWEEGIYLLPMWHQSMYMPKDLWIFYTALINFHSTGQDYIIH